MTTLALGFSLSLRMILSNSPAFGSRGIFTDWEMQRPPDRRQKRKDNKSSTEFFLCEMSKMVSLADILTLRVLLMHVVLSVSSRLLVIKYILSLEHQSFYKLLDFYL